MATHICPVCGDDFTGSGALRDHAWERHRTCHYCGGRIDSDDVEALYRHWLIAHPDDVARADYKRADAAVDSLTFSDRLEAGGVGAAVSGLSRRRLLLAGGAAVGAGLVGGAVLARDATDAGGKASDGPSSDVATAPVPAAPGDFRYATMGNVDATVTVTYYGNWKCPYCAQFSTGFLSQLVADYVAPGDVLFQFRNLAFVGGKPFLGADAPAAGRAGLAVWHTDPESYWRYHEYVFRHQLSESKQWASADRLVKFARAAGVSNPGAVRTAVEGNEYEDALRATTAAANDVGVSGTPTLVVDGTTVSPFKTERTRRLIEDAISNG
ncbi:MAG: DsbA family protein [Haloplanus sp.]